FRTAKPRSGRAAARPTSRSISTSAEARPRSFARLRPVPAAEGDGDEAARDAGQYPVAHEERREERGEREREQERPRRLRRHLENVVEVGVERRRTGRLVPAGEDELCPLEPLAVLGSIGEVPVGVRAPAG